MLRCWIDETFTAELLGTSLPKAEIIEAGILSARLITTKICVSIMSYHFNYLFKRDNVVKFVPMHDH